MNTDALAVKVSDIITTLKVFQGEAESIAMARKSLQRSEHVNTEREVELGKKEQRLIATDKELKQREEYITREQQSLGSERIRLEKIKTQVEELLKNKEVLEAREADIKKREEELALKFQKAENLTVEKEELERQQMLVARDREIENERQKLFEKREENLKQREERVSKVEELTQV